MSVPKHVTILGAGLSGLTTAYRLSQLLPSTSKITLLEGSDRLGGWIQSTSHHIDFTGRTGKGRAGEVLLENGPRSIRPRGSSGAPKMLQLIRELGLENDILPVPRSHPSARNRYILDTAHSPPRLGRLSLNPFTSPLTLSTLLTASMEPCQPGRPQGVEDESIDCFLRRRFGEGVAHIASAGMHGIYAASTTSLSAKAILGRVYDMEKSSLRVVLGWMWKSWKSRKKLKQDELDVWGDLGQLGLDRDGWAHYGLRGGLESLTERLGRTIRDRGVQIRLNEKVEKLELVGEGVALPIQVTTARDTFPTSHLISALSPKTNASLLPLPFAPSTTTSVGVVSLVYPLPASTIHPIGFGYLIPRPRARQPDENPEGVLGVVFDDSSMPGLDSPDLEGNITKLTVMIGGPFWSTYSPRLPMPASSDELPELAIRHLEKVFPTLKDVKPILVKSALHKDCIPTYTPGHNGRLKELHAATRASQWNNRLSLVGNGYGGVGVNDCVQSAEVVARAMSQGTILTGLETWEA